MDSLVCLLQSSVCAFQSIFESKFDVDKAEKLEVRVSLAARPRADRNVDHPGGEVVVEVILFADACKVGNAGEAVLDKHDVDKGAVVVS